MGAPLPLAATCASVFSNASDVYVTVRVTVDKKSHVAPIASNPLPARPAPAQASTEEEKSIEPTRNENLKFRSITKYSYFESGEKWVKVLIPDLQGLSSHPAEKVKIEFPTNRSFSVRVWDFKGENWLFAVPKLQCRILPQACTFSHKSSAL